MFVRHSLQNFLKPPRYPKVLQKLLSGQIHFALQVGNYKLGINVLGLITFCLTFGVIIGRMKDEGEILVKFFCAFNEAVMQIVSIVIW